MCSWHLFVLLLFISDTKCDSPPILVEEPPAELVFSNVSGAKASCSARGSPAPTVLWLHADGTTLQHLPQLRHVMENGTLSFPPFPGDQFRPDVHSTGYRCKAQNHIGVVVSREMRVQAVQRIDWSCRVVAARTIPGGPSVLSCLIPYDMQSYCVVTAWYRNDVRIATDSQGSMTFGPNSYLISKEGWRLVVWQVNSQEATARYSCSVRDTLTGDTRRSPPAHIDLLPPSSASAPSVLVPTPWETTVRRGTDVVLPCLLYGDPTPTITWFRETGGGESSPRAVAGEGRTLRVRAGASGRWMCRADNPHGHTIMRAMVHTYEPLAAVIQPRIQVINSGGIARFNCTTSGLPPPRLEWMHDGVPVIEGGVGGRVRLLSNGEQLIIANVQRNDRGVYQCLLRNERDSAQAAAELKLGDIAPELHYTFIEQVLRPGQVVTLKCSASGTPPPHFTWFLDAQPLNTMATGHRYSVEQFTSKNNEVVSYLNISSVRSEDGGLYTCRAANSLGEVVHTARLNIYGTPYIRAVGPIRAIAGRELVVNCPYSGYPITSVHWEKEGETLPSAVDGSLRLSRVSAGTLTCSVRGPSGSTARRDLQILVSNPPEIEPFSFSANLQEGKRAQVSCSVISGDMPVHFAWLKDDSPIPSTLQVEERGADFFSNLVFKEVSAHHSGLYTCVASNAAAKVNFTAELVVKVSPKWTQEPMDVSVLVGEMVTLHCQTIGSPTPRVTWNKQRGSSSDFLPLDTLGSRFQIFPNGSLWLDSVLSYDEGHYMCKAENGVGDPISKTVFVDVNEPARFELRSANMSARRDSPITLLCDVRGDNPIRVQWLHNMNHVDQNSYRLSISEAKTDSGLRSQLYISRADRPDSGLYKCQASNAYGHSDHLIYLSVQEKPDRPSSVSVTALESRSAVVSCSQGFTGNSPLLAFCVQLTHLTATSHEQHGEHESHVIHDAHTAQQQWDAAHTYNVSVHERYSTPHDNVVLTKKGDIHYEVAVNNLKPHTAYMIRLAAINQIDMSDYTEPIVFKTQEEAPSQSPLGVRCVALSWAEVVVRWSALPKPEWRGELLGYTVHCKAKDSDWQRTVTVNGWSTTEVTISGLKKYTRYEVTVRAFNSVAAGPPSIPVEVVTLEGVPESHPMHVMCAPLSSSSAKVSWVPPPSEHHGGVIAGYKVIYAPLDGEQDAVAEIKRVASTETYLHALNKYTNYSVQVLSFTSAGDGKRSPPVYCVTDEDVPSAPEKIKALAYSSDSVLVSWLPPLHPNGVITHYTIYYREAGRVGESGNSLREDSMLSLRTVVRGLSEKQLYEFWLCAETAAGQGPATSVVAQSPQQRPPARIWSFGGVVRMGVGSSLRLRCASAGASPLRTRWNSLRTIRPDAHSDLVLHDINEESSGNYTCTVSNSLGEDSITYTLIVLTPPTPPMLSLQYTTSTSIKVQWQVPKDGGSPILGYIVQHKLQADSDWQSSELSPEVTAQVFDSLRCGSVYNIRVQAKNRIGASALSDLVTANTRGGRPKAPKIEEHVTSNVSAIKVNLYAWRDNSCPITHFTVAYRKADAEHWIEASDNHNSRSIVLGDLPPGSWFEVSVEATNDAGTERAMLFVDTVTVDGDRPPPFRRSPPPSGLRWALGVAGGVALFTLCAALLCIARIKGHRTLWCWSQDYSHEDRKLSESHDTERDKLRNGQKLYSSNSINGNDKLNDDSSAELYEISPYATFGVISAAAENPLQSHERRGHCRGRREQRDRHRSNDHYRYDESSLSKSSTVEARHHRMRAACASANWRDSHTDSDDNSDSIANTTAKGSLSSSIGPSRRGASRSDSNNQLDGLDCTYGPVATDISKLIDKYQQRKEQERRECTIHV